MPKMKRLGLWLLTVSALLLAACDDTTSDRVSDVAKEGVSSMLRLLEKEVDQGNLAIRKCDRAYAHAREKLATLIALRDEAKAGAERTLVQMQEAEAAGKNAQYASYKSQHDFYTVQASKFDDTINRRAAKLKTVAAAREQVKVDVGLLRDKVDFLNSMRSALDEEDIQGSLDDAAELVKQMRQKSHQLSAEVEVLTIEE